jgi:branched-chain amino acid transport system ATP-binding protein
MLEVRALDVSIQSVSILRGLSLSVGAGRFVGLIGRNGAGKTTLMRAVMGILPYHGGDIQYDGRSMRAVPVHARARLGVGYMPEDRRLVPALSVEENVLLPAWSCRYRDSAERLRRVYEMVPEVAQFRHRKALELSGGQQKLVALARSLMCADKLLLLDEPFEGVAPVLARRLAEVIGSLRREGLSVMLAESGLAHVRQLLDAVFVIDRGEIVSET